MQLPSWTVKKGFFEFNYLDSTLLEINPYFEDISFHKFTVCKEQHLLLGRVLKILRKTIQLKFLPAARACSKNFEKVHSAEIFLKRLQLSFFLSFFFQNFSKIYSIEHLLTAASVLRKPTRLWILLQRYLCRFIL